ncbi:MAG TPA: hypothetical protein DCM14_01045 [Clostridiales bacterium UBA8153]|nr:hypothetical protein [Clostridiales bacterium UBA8153]
MHQLRRAPVPPGRDLLSGAVAVDDTVIGGEEEGVPGRQTSSRPWWAIAAEADGRRIGRIRMRRVPDASSGSLLSFIRDAIEPGSKVITEGWIGYCGGVRVWLSPRDQNLARPGQRRSHQDAPKESTAWLPF